MKLFTINRSAQKTDPYVETVNTADVQLSVSSGSELSRQIEMIGLTERDLAIVRSMKPLIDQELNNMIELFYSSITKQPGLLNIIEANSSIDRLKKTLRRHIEELFNGKVNDEFLQKRYRIAHVHVRIGLETKWYMSAFQNLLNSMTAIISAQSWDGEKKIEAIQAITKLLNLEQQIVLEAYELENERIRQEEFEKKEKLTQRVYNISQELASISEETSASVKELAMQSDSIKQIAQDGITQADESESHSLQGQKQLQEQNGKLIDIQSAVTDIQEYSTELNEISLRIVDVITIVGNIAGQTNLLALNASIEAARAGEYGKGFAVVAEEIRKLSDQTKESTTNVSTHITKTNELIKQMSQSVHTVNDLVETGIEGMNKTDQDFSKLLTLITQTKTQNNQIDEKLKQFFQVIKEIEKASGEVAQSAMTLNDTTEEFLND
ncbi:globin-coupled sensor protein [Domibacillus epiphyticus]|uniref:Methyl-accepting transducer domain-containing protein n=1 Tax=Domibacillus epiphyticus TaxID=1714355 RepID=A0A1V2A551_9BACI|nr:globin-coupled sensor protein [Domibacillus epiphyticus]OMP66128.1 hypothetical protein BTO28_14075 [Domibacillus epiphyticus]